MLMCKNVGALKNSNDKAKGSVFIYLYILRGFRKLAIIFFFFFNFKNTLNLINLSLFLKHKNEVKIVNWLKKKNTHVYKTTPYIQPKPPHIRKKKKYPKFL